MSIYMVNNHIRHLNLLEIHQIRENSPTKNIHELLINSLKEICGVDNLIIAKTLVCFKAYGASIMQG